MITVQNLKYPFEHTIIYDVFEPLQVTSLVQEAKDISKNFDKNSSIEMLANDEHNLGVIEKYGTRVFIIDKVMSDGVIRNLCWNVPKLFFLNAIEKTYLTNYFHSVSSDKLYLQLYKNGDSYPDHRDCSTFSIVYVFYDNPNSKFEGGKMRFTDFNYEPYLLHNSCIMFPGWINHEVSEFKTSDNNTRISLSQFMFQAYNHTSITQTKQINL
jgi:hypothetical protein